MNAGALGALGRVARASATAYLTAWSRPGRAHQVFSWVMRLPATARARARAVIAGLLADDLLLLDSLG